MCAERTNDDNGAPLENETFPADELFSGGDFEQEPWRQRHKQQGQQNQQCHHHQQHQQHQQLQQHQQPPTDALLKNEALGAGNFWGGGIEPEPWIDASRQKRRSSSLECLESAPCKEEIFCAEEFFSDDVREKSRSLMRQRSPLPPLTTPPPFEVVSVPPEIVSPKPRPPPPPWVAPPEAPPRKASGGIAMPLRRWIGVEAMASKGRPSPGGDEDKASVLAKTTVAYAIAELLRHHLNCDDRSDSSQLNLRAVCDPQNFIVRVADSDSAEIEGVDMLSPPISLKVTTPFFLSNEFWKDDNEKGQQEEAGRFVEVAIQGNSSDIAFDSADSQLGSSIEDVICHLFGMLLYELYSNMLPFSSPGKGGAPSMGDNGHNFKTGHVLSEEQPLLKKKSWKNFVDLTMDDSPPRSSDERRTRKDTLSGMLSSLGPQSGKNSSDLSFREQSDGTVNGGPTKKKAYATTLQVPTRQVSSDNVSRISGPSKFVPLKELGLPASISLLVKNLLDCGWDEFRPDDAVPSLKAASEDLHLLLLEPDRFLFDRVLAKNGTGGAAKPDIKQNKLYGREADRSLITDIFCRLSSTGESEALFIEGYSGSGKSSLVKSVVSFIDFYGGYVAQRKFDQVSQERPTSVVIGAFDDLCPLIRNKNSQRELNEIVANLMAVFGTHLSTLTRLLPGVASLSPELNALTSSGRGGNREINLGSAYFILQLFARVVSSKSHPIMLFLDDLHWADSASLDGLQYILSDPHGCVYVVCSYRTNEVPSDHAVFRLAEVLRACDVRLSRARLVGMSLADVNRMISDALGTFPRTCMPLSRLVLRRTEGNPLFVIECLRSLADRDLLRYSVRERRWEWDAHAIAAEDVADNVCELFREKMINLPEATRSALKIAACFGMTLASTVVESLMSASPEFDGLCDELHKVVGEGFMDEDGSTSLYRFVHDKVREAAYGLIPEQERNQFHYDIGSILHGRLRVEDNDDMIFLIVDQMNHGAIDDPHQRVAVAELNHRAASKAMGNSNFAAAYFYSGAAVGLLPTDRWESHYDMSRSVFLVLGNAAYMDGHGDEAMSALDEILSHGKSLKDKLDAYYLKSALLNARQEPYPAYDTCVEVLTQLGETIPSSVVPIVMAATVRDIKSKLGEMTESDFMSMRTMDSPFHYSLMQFYSQVCYLSYFVHTPMLKWFACRLVEISLEHGFCKYSALGIMRFSMVLGGKLLHDVRGGYEVGKVALKLLERFDATDLLPHSYLCYYGFIAVHIEPFQSCADMLKRGFEIGLSIADTQMAFLCGIHFIQKSFVSGANLPILKKECDYQMRLIEAHSQPMTKMYMSALQETLAVLISKEAPSKNWSEEDVSRAGEFSEAIIFHGVVQNFWLGRYDRCLYYVDRSSASSDIGKIKSILIIFYGGLSSFHSSKKISKKFLKIAEKASRSPRCHQRHERKKLVELSM